MRGGVLIVLAAASLALVATSCSRTAGSCRGAGGEWQDGPADTGLAGDPAVEDAGVSASQSTDAGTEADAGRGDAGVPPDAGIGEAPPIPPIEDLDDEKTASAEEWTYLSDPAGLEEVLSSSPVRWGKSKSQTKTMSRIGAEARALRFKIVLKPKDGQPITAQLKVRQTDYYFEWKREILAYRIGRMIGAPVVPAVDRTFPGSDFRKLAKDLPETDVALVKFEKYDAVRGSVRYWVDSLHARAIGKREADEAYLLEIAAALHPDNREALSTPAYTVYLEIGKALVFDYLVLNDDRARNLGTVLAPDGVRHLVLIDNGLAMGLEGSERTNARGYFEAMTLFPKDVIDGIRALDEIEVHDLLVPKGDEVLAIKQKAADQLWERRSAILARVDELHDQMGDRIYYW